MLWWVVNVWTDMVMICWRKFSSEAALGLLSLLMISVGSPDISVNDGAWRQAKAVELPCHRLFPFPRAVARMWRRADIPCVDPDFYIFSLFRNRDWWIWARGPKWGHYFYPLGSQTWLKFSKCQRQLVFEDMTRNERARAARQSLNKYTLEIIANVTNSPTFSRKAAGLPKF